MSSTGTPTSNLGLNQWLPNDKPERADFNSDNQKIDAHMYSIMHQLSSETYTVEMANLQTFIDSLPKLLTKDITINVNAGMLSGTLTIERFYGLGRLSIKGATTASAETHQCTNVVIRFNTCNCIRIDGITAIGTGNAFNINQNVSIIDCYYCNVAGTNTSEIGMLAESNSSLVRFLFCTVSNTTRAFRCAEGTLSIHEPYGVNNAIVFSATYASVLAVRGIGTISGTTIKEEVNGSQVIMPATYGTNNDTAVVHGKYAMGNVLNAAPNYSTAIGAYALQKAIGTHNIAVGGYALNQNTTGMRNTVLGVSGLRNNARGNENVAIGMSAMENAECTQCVGIGMYSLLTNTGNFNVGIGTSALRANTSGTGNTAIGQDALCYSTTGVQNTALGKEAGYANTIGSNNTAIGYRALYSNSNAGSSVAIGPYSLQATTAGGNVGIGYQAGNANTTGNENTFIGFQAGCANTTGVQNTFIGNIAGGGKITGHSNTCVGHRAGQFLSDGSTTQTTMVHSTYLGSLTKGSSSDSQSNQIVIGYGAQGYGSNTAHIGNSSVASISYGAATGTTFTNRSDPRIKENIKDADLEKCLENVKSLPLHYFKYKDFVGNEGDRHVLGFLSPEFGEILPKAVHRNTMTFDERDAGGNVIYETRLVDEYIDEEVEVEVEVADSITDPETGETRTQTRTEARIELQSVTKQIEKEVPKQIVIEDCESVDSSQLVPILWGAVQKLVTEIDVLKAQIAELQEA